MTSENDLFPEVTPRVASEKTGTGRSRPRQPASENTGPSGIRRRGARPTALPTGSASVLERYAAALADVPLAEETKRTYLSRVRMYLAWLASPPAARRPGGDPLADPRARDWAVRDYRHWLLREADPKPSARYANNALAALDDFYTSGSRFAPRSARNVRNASSSRRDAAAARAASSATQVS